MVGFLALDRFPRFLQLLCSPHPAFPALLRQNLRRLPLADRALRRHARGAAGRQRREEEARVADEAAAPGGRAAPRGAVVRAEQRREREAVGERGLRAPDLRRVREVLRRQRAGGAWGVGEGGFGAHFARKWLQSLGLFPA